VGDVIHVECFNAAASKTERDVARPRKRKVEPFIAVPARILPHLRKLEDSISDVALDPGDPEKHLCWKSFFAVLAILGGAVKYE